MRKPLPENDRRSVACRRLIAPPGKEAMISLLAPLIPFEISLADGGEVPGAGHVVAGDRNEALNEGVLAFLDRHHPVKKQSVISASVNEGR